MGDDAVDRLEHDDPEVEQDAEGEHAHTLLGRRRMSMRVRMSMSMVVRAVVHVRARREVARGFWASSSTLPQRSMALATSVKPRPAAVSS